jgi:hypothetical protein
MSDVGRFILNKLIPLEMMILDDYFWEALNYQRVMTVEIVWVVLVYWYGVKPPVMMMCV